MTWTTFAPTLLLSMPQLQDPNFTRTVVLLCDYTEEGAFGLVLNRPTDMPATTMVKLEPPIAGGNELPLSIGGPVEPERGCAILSTPSVSTAPLPAALPLFATGLGAMGLFGWWRKRKARAIT